MTPLLPTPRLVAVLDALSTIQEHTHIQVRIPDLTTTPIRIARRWCQAARLLQGERLVPPWSELIFNLHPGTEEGLTNFGLSAVTIPQQLTVEIGDVEIELGRIISHIPIARYPAFGRILKLAKFPAKYVPADFDEMTIYMLLAM